MVELDSKLKSVKAIILDFGESEEKREEMMTLAMKQIGRNKKFSTDWMNILNQWRFTIASKMLKSPEKTYEKYFLDRLILLSFEEVLLKNGIEIFDDYEKREICQLWYQSIFLKNAITGLDILIQNYPIIPISILSTAVMMKLFESYLTDWEAYINGATLANFQQDEKFNRKCLDFLSLDASETMILTKSKMEDGSMDSIPAYKGELGQAYLAPQISELGIASQSIKEFFKVNNKVFNLVPELSN